MKAAGECYIIVLKKVILYVPVCGPLECTLTAHCTLSALRAEHSLLCCMFAAAISPLRALLVKTKVMNFCSTLRRNITILLTVRVCQSKWRSLSSNSAASRWQLAARGLFLVASLSLSIGTNPLLSALHNSAPQLDLSTCFFPLLHREQTHETRKAEAPLLTHGQPKPFRRSASTRQQTRSNKQTLKSILTRRFLVQRVFQSFPAAIHSSVMWHGKTLSSPRGRISVEDFFYFFYYPKWQIKSTDELENLLPEAG